MRQKCMTILKVSVALILALMMVVGSISTVVAATITIEQSESTTDSTAADNKAADVADDPADAPAQSVPLTDKLVRLVKDDIAGTGANVDIAETGYTNCKIKGTWDNWELHDITSSAFTKDLAAGTDYSFVYVAENGDQFSSNTTISGTTDYNFSRNGNDSITLHTTIAGTYTFKFTSWGTSGDSISVRIEFPANTTVDTWTVAGGTYGNTTGGESDPLFTETWNTTLTQNDMTNTSGNTWTWSKNNVTLAAGKILCKVVKNHAWETFYPTGATNQESNNLTAGTYNVTITFDSSTKVVAIKATPAAMPTLSVQSEIANATVTATYNGTTVDEGGHIDNIPVGAQVTINVTPAQGKKCTAVTGTYSGGTASATSDGTGRVWTMTMPAENTEVSATIENVSLKKIYFNNNYTLYGTVYAYVYDKDGSTETNLYLGKKPGKVMIESENSEIWYIEVPETITYVQFISGEGYTTGEMQIPWPNSGLTETYTYPKYTAPYGHNDAPTTTNGGTWGDYIWGTDNKRGNEYTVTDGSTMSDPNLFTGISATLYDYYTDNEVTNAWLTGITSADYNMGSGWSWDPYTKLNQNLSAYADNSNLPLYNVTYPLYFGNLAVDEGEEGTDDLTKNYYHFNRPANNSQALGSGHSNDAVTGLSGKSLGDDDTIHYYSADDSTNENGAPMAMFNEDFLSGENKTGDTLATILRTSSFPVRTETFQTIVFDPNGKVSDTVKMHYWKDSNSNDNGDATGTVVGGKYYYTLPAGYDRIAFFTDNWVKKTADLSVDLTKTKYTCSTVSDNIINVTSAAVSVSTHNYYEYDSTDGKDNAFITNIDTTAKTANIDYYADSSGKYVQSNSGTKGFFPFDYNNIVNEKGTIYFNASLCTGGDSYWAHFFNGGATKDVKMEQIGTSNIYKVGVPGNYTNVIFTRNSGTNAPDSNWSNVHNQTDTLTLHLDDSSKIQFNTSGYNSKIMTGSWGAYTGTAVSGDGYADVTNHYAHDQGFGMKLEILFNLNNNGLNNDGTPQTFDFSGDDDLWVYIDGKLALDLGGAHGRTTGSINFNTMTATANNSQSIANGITRNGDISSIVDTSASDFNPNYVHTMTIYYMERGMFDSNLKFGFSFHAIPNMFWVDKKIRTKDKYNLGYDTLNSGFFTDNGKSGDDSNMTTYNNKSMSKFEASFQNEEFKVEQKVNHNNGGFQLISNSLGYTIDNDSTTYYPSSGQYQIKHDLGICFVGKFEKNDVFNLKEIIGANNKYVYQPVFSVWDQANNDQTVTHTGNNSDGYEFTFAPTTAVTGGIDMLNLKARFDNYIVAHDLTLTKEITNAVDTTTDFTFQIKFDFTGTDQNPNYVAYPLYCDVDGVRQNLNNDGEITVKAGQKVVIIDIPENAKVQVKEVLTDSVSGYRYNGITLTKGGLSVDPTSTDNSNKSINFTMGDADMAATISNKKPDNSYSITYIYPSYDNLYGNQGYTVTGVFTKSELETYMDLGGSAGIQFKSDALKQTFVNTKAPYEDNFHQTLSFAGVTIADSGTSSFSSNNLGWDAQGKYVCEATAATTTSDDISVYFSLPYDVESDSTLVPKEDSSTQKIAKLPENKASGSKKIDFLDWYVTSGAERKTAEWTPNATTFVKAPLMIYTNVADNNTVQYFQYWSVKKLSTYGMSSAEYTRCYDYEFNLSLFMDCYIEPVYAGTWAQEGNPNPPQHYNSYDRFDPELQIIAASDKKISVTFLENSRNQYNNNQDGTTGGPKDDGRGNAAGDVIYSDFLLSYNNNPDVQLNLDTSGNKKAGLVIESVGYLEGSNAEGFNGSKDYSKESVYTSSASTKKDQIVTWLTSGTKATGLSVDKSQFDVTALDNKNCIQYYYSFNNRKLDNSTGQLLNTTQNRYKVFRAYAYIGEVNGENLTNVVVSDPIYFTIYDTGKLYDLADNANVQ